MFETKREARIYKDSIDVFILEDDKKTGMRKLRERFYMPVFYFMMFYSFFA